jgi:hypothetical protein
LGVKRKLAFQKLRTRKDLGVYVNPAPYVGSLLEESEIQASPRLLLLHNIYTYLHMLSLTQRTSRFALMDFMLCRRR